MADAPKTTPEKPVSQSEPKIVQKLAIRTLVAVLALGGLFVGLRSFLGYNRDPGQFGSVDTKSMIAAIEFNRDGQQAVVIRPDGSILKSPDYKAGQTDRDIVWQPDGGRVYYVSDRQDQTYQIFRWRPSEGGESEPRTIGSRGKSYPSFAPDAEKHENFLIASMGTILELDPVERKTHQVLPPVMNEVPQGTSDEEGGGGASLFHALYGELGDSFARAQFLPGANQVVAVMRGNRGEVLVLQDLAPQGGGKLKRPEPIAAGERIEFSVSKDGTIVFSIQNFTFPTDEAEQQARQSGQTKPPYRHAVAMYSPAKKERGLLIASDADTQAFGQPAISPDGTRVLFIGGKFDGTNLDPQGLLIKSISDPLPPSPVVMGQVFEPSWSPDGNRIAYVKREGGKRAIFTANADGTDEKNLTGDKGDFSHPLFSPQR